MFPERLRALRTGRNLSLPELAQALNKMMDEHEKNDRDNTGPQIGSWERGINTPSYLEVKKLAEYFNVSLDYLIGRPVSEIDLNEVLLAPQDLVFSGEKLTTQQRYEIYEMLKGYLHGHEQQVADLKQQTQEITLLLD
ncbi:helix-turn-helix domain-containing protein [Ligilactobacillus ceti]|uniref:HTH cro/C1-type domain-containing protein n=1 Tax=Ligilactobacillus ceti DSM 22408 TaxID=1122146 RepID=A0A0R2KQH9_9LACO|nr:helix-turn-helix transcriptional regulator [Ligilactobacillus ceti]KRN89813.1 hypothetical protein IV53_GL001140 [Ligilactobacillus ceti DSM 22408]